MIWLIVILLAIIAATLLLGREVMMEALGYVIVITGTIGALVLMYGVEAVVAYELGWL